MHVFDAVNGSSHGHRERLLAVPSGLIEQQDGLGALREARGGAGPAHARPQKLRLHQIVIHAAASGMRRVFIALCEPRREHQAPLQQSRAQAV